MLVWLITGSTRGLGLEFCTQLSSSSENTIIATTRSLSRPNPALEALQKKAKGEGKEFHILECDTSSTSSIQKFRANVAELSIGKIDFLLNNAGINSTPSLTVLSMTPESFSDHMTTNVLGPATLVQVLDSANLLGKGSVVMNMTSGLGSMTETKRKGVAACGVYSISKAALNMLTVHQSLKLKSKGVIVICVDPGWVKTDMGGEGAILEKEVSIAGMLKVLKGVEEGDEGKFFLYDGSEKGW